MSDGSNSIPNALVSHHRSKLSEAAREFDDTVRRAVGIDAWSLDALGPVLNDPHCLAAVNDVVVDHGARLTLTKTGEPLHWIVGREALAEAYLAHLSAADGQRWSTLSEALEEMWSMPPWRSAEEIRAAQRTKHVLAASADRLLMREPKPIEHFELSGDWEEACQFFTTPHDLITRYLRNRALDALEGCWHRAFVEGRIVVFREEHGRWILDAPHVWQTSPPFPCRSLRDLYDAFIERPALAPNPMLEEVYGVCRALGRLPLRQETLRASESAGPTYAFLLSNTCAPLSQDRAAAKALGGPRSQDRRRVHREVRAWFQAEIAAGRSWNRKKQQALKDLAAKAQDVSGVNGGWGNIADNIWAEVAPQEWRQGGAARKTD